MRRFLVCLGFFGLTGTLPVFAGEPAPALDPRMPLQGKKSNPVTYDIDFSVVVTAPYQTKTLKVWLAMPQSDVGQTIEASQLCTFPMKVAPKVAQEKVHGNQFAYFEFDRPKGAQIIRHKFKATIHEMRWHIDPAKVAKIERWPVAFDLYRKSDRSVTVDARLQKLVLDVVRRSTNESDDLASIMRWVSGYMKYDHAGASLKASADHALTKKAGHCSDYHGLCAALGRALGYPTRVTYGINPFPKNSPSHCKLEAFLPPYGWVCFDVSETQKLMAAIQKDKTLSAKKKAELIRLAEVRLQSGFRDNTWLQQTRGTDYELVPPAQRRVPVVRTIYAEADGVALIDPDPANAQAREFGWMTVHHYVPNRPVEYSFKSWKSLMK
ncbi:MAG: transglutaminase domain-containing protein [Planctomycetes bacterium]|nr:transglutaminase domain-containing protein [Planctomycetota bacterium]